MEILVFIYAIQLTHSTFQFINICSELIISVNNEVGWPLWNNAMQFFDWTWQKLHHKICLYLFLHSKQCEWQLVLVTEEWNGMFSGIANDLIKSMLWSYNSSLFSSYLSIVQVISQTSYLVLIYWLFNVHNW